MSPTTNNGNNGIFRGQIMSPTTNNGIFGGLNSLINSIDSLAMPIEKGVGGFSQIYTQVHQLNPQAQTTIPVNEMFYQAPNNSLTGNFASGLGNMFGQIPGYVWGLIIVGGVIGLGVLTRNQ